MKSVLHIGFSAPTFINSGWKEAFKENGITEYVFLDWHKLRMNVGFDGAWQRIYGNCAMIKPDLVFIQCNTDGFIYKEEIALIRKSCDAKIILQNIDVRNDIEWMKDIVGNLDLLFVSNIEDAYNAELSWKDNCFVMQSSCDMSVYKKLQDTQERFDIVFIGNNYSRSNVDFDFKQERFDMIEHLGLLYQNSFVFGNNWHATKLVNVNDEIQIYNSAKIAINHNQFNRTLYTSDRLWRIMACGCFCLTKYFEGIETIFERGIHLDWWKDFDELSFKIDYYLENEDERKAIANQGMLFVRENHAPTNRINYILNLLNNKSNEFCEHSAETNASK